MNKQNLVALAMVLAVTLMVDCTFHIDEASIRNVQDKQENRNTMNEQTLVESSYAPVNGLELYYEIHGAGQPLVLLHGGIGAMQMFGEVLPGLTHNNIFSSPALASTVTPFLDAPMPKVTSSVTSQDGTTITYVGVRS